ncbi:MAG: hypothetical protein PUP92_10710, partial [Rhizonema sp. PD38]|nr:hypothetical protein [Rhizonema sp. PD38]
SKLLVKQERHKQGKAAGEFLGEWLLKEFLQRFSELNHLRLFLLEVLHYDKENSIIVQLVNASVIISKTYALTARLLCASSSTFSRVS